MRGAFDTSKITTFNQLKQEVEKSAVKYDLEKIQKAYELALKIHGDQKRLSGEKIIEHSLTIAVFIIRLKLDTTSVIASLLHDTIDKGTLDIDDIDKEFGTDTAFIVDGLTTISNYSRNFSETQETVENFKNLIFNAAEDIRIIIIRLAEKVSNIDSLELLPDEVKIKSAKKCLLIYGPLAEYLGLGAFRSIIEEGAFKILHKDEYQTIDKYLKEYELDNQKLLNKFKDELEDLLESYGIENFRVQFRMKGYYSIYRKAIKKYTRVGEGFGSENISQLRDIFAFRIITQSIEDSYLILGLIHSKWEYLKEEFDDYISRPKENGYKSIHSVVSYGDNFIEVQIRTEEMHEYNEFGPASHIAYKLQGSGNSGDSYTWTKDLVKWKDSSVSKEDFKVKAFAESIFVFTPKGLIIRLDKDASPIDFAFRVHTKIGERYSGALVNGKMVSMDYKLQTGDVVEIKTNKNSNVNRDWLKFAKANYARSKIRRLLLKEE